jgi:transposase-like protein
LPTTYSWFPQGQRLRVPYQAPQGRRVNAVGAYFTHGPDAAKRFFQQARTVVGHAPEKVTTDGHDAYPRAIRETLGPEVRHRTSTSRYLNNRMEQDHRGIKQRYYPMRGFGSFEAAARLCSAHEELRSHLRSRRHLKETVSLAEQRRMFQERWGEVCAVLQAS